MNAGPVCAVRLPRGMWRGPVGQAAGSWISEVELRPLNGHDEEYLAAIGTTTRTEIVTELLHRCVVRIEGGTPDTFDATGLTLGDREALLMHLRQQQFGNLIDGNVACPDEACGERLDLDVTVDDLLVDPDPDPSEWYEEQFGVDEVDIDIRFRLPTGADQYAVATRAETDDAELGQILLDRCVDSASGPDGAVDVQHLPPETLAAVGDRMADLDPQAEIRLAFTCPLCDREIDVLFDAATYLLAEIQASSANLMAEIHALAGYYHWSEADILALTRQRRRRYLQLIADTVESRSSRGAA